MLCGNVVGVCGAWNLGTFLGVCCHCGMVGVGSLLIVVQDRLLWINSERL